MGSSSGAAPRAVHSVESFVTSKLTECRRLAKGLDRASRGDEELVTCKQCLRRLHARQATPESPSPSVVKVRILIMVAEGPADVGSALAAFLRSQEVGHE